MKKGRRKASFFIVHLKMGMIRTLYASDHSDRRAFFTGLPVFSPPHR